MRNIVVILFSILLCPLWGFAQSIQWASGVISETNAYGADGFGAQAVLGAPDATPYGELNPKAFRLKSENGNGSLILSFAQPQEVKQVIIMENNFPGRIERVYLYDEAKNRYSVLEDTYRNDEPFGYLTIPVTIKSNTITQVEIRLNAAANSGWAQIDAVGITSSDDPSVGKRVLQQLEEDERLELLSQKVTRRNLGLHVNTTFDEVKPVVSVDGKRLYFSRQYAPTNLGGSKDMLDIYYADLINDSWSEAKNVGTPLNNLNPNGVASVTADGRNLLLINRYRKDGRYDLGLSITESKDGTWQYPQDVEIEDFVNVNDFVDYSLSPNGDVLIMAIENKESIGDQDLYVSFYKGANSWTRPQNLGSILNTAKEDFSPFIAPDGVTLYFASAGHGGMGGSDIFYTRRLDDTWLNWSEPINLGETVNTDGFDGYFSISANTNIAYVVSQTGGRANSRDIYQVRIPPELTPQESYMLIGTVYDAATKNPLIDAEVAIAGGMIQRPNVLRTDEMGGYKVMLPKSGEFNASVSAEGYDSLKEVLDVSEIEKEKLEVRNDFFLNPMIVAEPQPLIVTQSKPKPEPISAVTASLSSTPVITELPKYEEKIIPKTFPEEEKIYNLYFKVVDAVTNEEIPHSRLVFGLDALEEEPLSVSNNRLGNYSRQMTMDESTIYLKAEAAGYESERKIIPPDDWKNRMDKEFIIYLNPVPGQEGIPAVAGASESDAATRLLESYNLNGVATRPKERILEVSGNVLDAKTKKPIPATVRVASQSAGMEDMYKANPQGFFKLSNPGWNTYELEILHEGYYTKKESLHIERVLDERGIARVVYYLEPIEKGETITLNNLWFIKSTPELVEFSFPVLDSLGQVMMNNPTLEIKLTGHTDGIGDYQKNQNLSELRVAFIKDYIVNMGIHPKRIRIEAFGSRFPIASNAREETRKLNRRVEVTILKF